VVLLSQAIRIAGKPPLPIPDRKMIALSGQAVVPGAAQRSRVRWN
jgi:hypothetical protein